ncbi:MAG: SLC13 family permease [Akkermansiaceae bacterium]|nr:SLC13 family permease [Akkermansiaceae bacterium]
MTPEIAAVLAILGVSLVLFVTEKLRMDVVALLVLGTLGVSGLVTLEEALAGFSNPAVVTVWAMFILSAGLSATGIADIIGRQVLALAGTGEVRMILVIMLTTGVLSAFMNNIGVAALMLPVVMDIARRTETSPSRLLMPMAYASLLGGLTTLIGTPPNLVASTVLRQSGHGGFELFEFAPIGVPALAAGALFIALVGRHLLPAKMPEEMRAGRRGPRLQFNYDLADRRFRLRVADGSPLHDRALSESGLAGTLGLTVLSIDRGNARLRDIGAETRLASGDILTVQGRIEDFREFLTWQALEMATGSEILEVLSLDKIALMHAEIAEGSPLAGLTVEETDFQRRFGAHILEVERSGKKSRDGIAAFRLKPGDRLLLQARREALPSLENRPEFAGVTVVGDDELAAVYPSSDSLLELIIPADSHLVGTTIAESGIGETLRLRVIGIARKGGSIYFPGPDEAFRHGDQLLVVGRPESLQLIRAIQSLELVNDVEPKPSLTDDSHGLAEVTLSPRSTLAGRTVRDIHFRRNYGLQVLAIWRKGHAYRSYLHKMHLEFGDALLLFGPRDRVASLADDSDFIVLTRSAYKETARRAPGRAALAGGLMLAVVIAVLSGWLPIAIAAVAGAALMVALRCLTMEDAYRSIEWKSVFLIAGMIPLGTAMESSGAAKWLAEGVTTAAAPFGVWGLLIGIYLLTMLATTIVPTTALVLIMAPIAIQSSSEMNLDPRLLMMGVAMAASASFTSPISHPANVLVMGPGGYRFLDYVKMGILLAIVVMVTVLPLIVLRYG